MSLLTERDKEWISEAIEKGFTRLQLKKKLQSNRFTEERIELYLNYYDERISKQPKEETRDKEDEKEFKENVQKFFSDNKSDLSWSEKREIKKFLKGVAKYKGILKVANEEFRKELEYITKQDWSKGKVDEELKDLKQELIDRLIESKVVLDIEHPVTGEDITKENLQSLDIDALIKLIDENVEELDLIVNGKITE